MQTTFSKSNTFFDMVSKNIINRDFGGVCDSFAEKALRNIYKKSFAQSNMEGIPNISTIPITGIKVNALTRLTNFFR